ncbi:MAG: 16S rRNA (guanine(527)-N(7))-methyltransferase RsmG [Kofleriaceae bacterium]
MPVLDRALQDLSASEEVRRQLDAFIELFARWNAKINLSAARDRPAIRAQVADSLYIVPHLAGASAVLDVGSGGGLPVFPAALWWPQLQFTALEPVHKKHAFLRTAARQLGALNLDARAERLEDHLRADYDVAMSRATFDVREWVERGLLRVRPGGRVLAMEGLRRDDLPRDWERHEYAFADKQRAILVAHRPPLPPAPAPVPA